MKGVDSWMYRTLNRNLVLRCGAVLMLVAGAVRHWYEMPLGEPWPLKISKLAVYVGTALGIASSGILPAALKPDLPPVKGSE
jgi:hypothetical protein